MTKSSQPSKNISSASKLDILRKITFQAISARLEVGRLLDEPLEKKPFPDITKSEKLTQDQAEKIIIKIFQRFHRALVSLRERRRSKPPILIEDEYDVQDFLESMLKIYFDDVRPEDPTPSTAGSFSFIDFILYNHKIGIEAKMVYKGHTSKKIKKEITLDKNDYRNHTECEKLLCLIYDPEYKIRNPDGFESGLSDNVGGLFTKVFVVPKP